MEKWILKPPPLETDIYFGLTHLAAICKQGIILADQAIVTTHGAAIQKMLGFELIPIKSGEQNKTRVAKEALENELFKKKIQRDDVFAVVGGGVAIDLAGFVASTYMRGAPLVLIPTTLLAMVDAAIGGKTGVDTSFGKNTIGSFYLPKAVFIEADFLKTLPAKEMKNGLSEILKYGLIASVDIWQRCAKWETEIAFLIRASIRCKMTIIQEDFEEKSGLRRSLNFGHTVAHALELISHYTIAHGEAVAIGCMAESYLSHLLGYLSSEILEQILSMYRNLGYTFRKFDERALANAMAIDKKAKGGEPRFVLIDRIGHCLPFDGEYCSPSNKNALEKTMKWINHD